MTHGFDAGFLVAAEVTGHPEHEAARIRLAEIRDAGGAIRHGHLRQDNSLAQAQRVSFGCPWALPVRNWLQIAGFGLRHSRLNAKITPFALAGRQKLLPLDAPKAEV